MQWACDEGPSCDVSRAGVDARGGGGGGDGAYPCVVECQTTDSDGAVCSQRIECNHVVVTVGLGVLKVTDRTDRVVFLDHCFVIYVTCYRPLSGCVGFDAFSTLLERKFASYQQPHILRGCQMVKLVTYLYPGCSCVMRAILLGTQNAFTLPWFRASVVKSLPVKVTCSLLCPTIFVLLDQM